MDFWSVYEAEKAKPEFGSGRLYIASRDRIHLSLSSVETYGTTLDINQAIVKGYKEEERFVLAKDLTNDLFISIYDVNVASALLLRASMPLAGTLTAQIIAKIKKIKNPNLEMRLAGLQDKGTELLPAVESFHKAFKSSLMEVDLFGNEIRHLVFDLKLGMLFNLLLLNRIYRPGELVNATILDEFNKRRSELKFV